MGFLSKSLIILAVVWIAWLSLSLASTEAKNKLLREQNEELINYLNDALNDKATLKANLTHCDATISSLNQSIKEAMVKVDNAPLKEVEQIKKIYVKDKSCEAELKAYKELFK